MRWRTAGRVAATVLVGLVVPGAAAAAGIAGATGAIYTDRDHGAPPAPVTPAAAPGHDPGKPTAVVVLGSEGANVADVLAPYEVLAGADAARHGAADRAHPPTARPGSQARTVHPADEEKAMTTLTTFTARRCAAWFATISRWSWPWSQA
jgi:hypothetical protein